MSDNRTKWIKALVFLAFAGTVACVVLFTPAGNRLLSQAGRKEVVGQIDHLVAAAGPLGPSLFVLIFTLGVLGLPATPFAAAGAFIFGKVAGTVYNIAGATLGASISFMLGRYFLREFAQGFLIGKLGELDRKAEQHGFSIVFYLRLLWFPFIFLNYGAGATRVRFRDFFWATFLGITPPIVIETFFFGSLKDITARYRGPADLLQADVLFPAVLLGFSLLLPRIIRRLKGEEPPEPAPAAQGK